MDEQFKGCDASVDRIERKRERARRYHARNAERINRKRRERYAQDMKRVRELEKQCEE